MPLSPEQFFAKLLPAAQQVRKETGIPVSVTLAQWAIESGFESPDWVGGNNYAGITKGNPSLGFRTYANVEEFTKDYISTINLSYYDAVRGAAKQGAPVVTVAETLGRSPWDEAGYTDPEQGYRGSSMVKAISQYDLLRYEAAPDGATGPGKAIKDAVTSVTGSWWTDKAWWTGTAQKVGIILAGVLLIGFALWFMGSGTVVKVTKEALKGE